MKFVVVNGRTPRRQTFCALCCEPIGKSYLRELTTRLSYCDHRCYVGHRKIGAHDSGPGDDFPRPARKSVIINRRQVRTC